MTMKHFSILRSPTWSSSVVPVSSDDQFSSCNGISAMQLVHNVEDSVILQKNVAEIVSDPNTTLPDPILIQGVEILDVCNFLLEKTGFVKKYAESVQTAVHLIKPGMAPVAVARVKELLDERRDVEKSGSRMKRLLKRLRFGGCDVLTMSMEDALVRCRILDAALSFKRGKRSAADGSMKQMMELRDVMDCAKRVRDLTVEKGGEIDTWHVEKMKMKCERLVEAVELLEEKVKELYSRLLCVRVAMLGVISYQKI